jgi:beta-lactamase superfamily II metal-dependent hydrolase
MSPVSQEVVVRMYEVGFGDAFLLTFPGPDRPRKVLIDCGCHVAGPPRSRPFKEVVGQIIDDLRGRADVVVASHRHRDHVLGFEDERFREVEVGEVWMPWTEDPADPEARRVREAQARKASSLVSALAGATDAASVRARQVAENNLTNAKAMAMLHGGFAGSPPARFLPEASQILGAPLLPQVLNPALLPGVVVHVLGPARDRATIKDMDPPVTESFLRTPAAGTAGEDSPALDPRWSISPRGKDFAPWFKDMAAKPVPLDPARPLRPADPDFLPRWFASLELTSRSVKQVDDFAAADPLAAAVAIEKAVNGTSLMLAFEAGRAMLLFPGDAQWGTWKRALQEDPASRAILARTSFLKVGHHGSHNASPRTFVNDVLGPDFRAMVSTRETAIFGEIPRIPLLEALAAKQSTPEVARSDVAQVPSGFTRISDICIEARIPI